MADKRDNSVMNKAKLLLLVLLAAVSHLGLCGDSVSLHPGVTEVLVGNILRVPGNRIIVRG